MNNCILEEPITKEQITLRITEDHRNDLLIFKSSKLYKILCKDPKTLLTYGFINKSLDRPQFLQIIEFEKYNFEEDSLIFYQIYFRDHDNLSFCNLIGQKRRTQNK